jgi:hypothetical protein
LRIETTEKYTVLHVGGAASDLGIRNSIQPWHDCTNIKAKPFSPPTGRILAQRLFGRFQMLDTLSTF